MSAEPQEFNRSSGVHPQAERLAGQDDSVIRGKSVGNPAAGSERVGDPHPTWWRVPNPWSGGQGVTPEPQASPGVRHHMVPL